MRPLSTTFHIHGSVSDLCIYSQDQCSYSATGPSWEYINRSQTDECGNWDWGRAFTFLGIHKWDFCCSVQKSCLHVQTYYNPSILLLRAREAYCRGLREGYMNGGSGGGEGKAGREEIG